MTRQIAEALAQLERRLSPKSQTDPWALVWQLAVGATYSLNEAQSLLPGSTGEADFRVAASEILDSIASERAPDLDAHPTWALGFYLNSAEARIQAALHRLLRTYTRKDDYALTLIQHLERLPSSQQPPAKAMAVLSRVRQGFAEDQVPGASIARIWARSNSVKHDPAQDVNDQFGFQRRWEDCEQAVKEITMLLDLLGTERGGIAAV